jgi:TATA-box binding protein (TBP) (component of TFIID and TFIIIB)
VSAVPPRFSAAFSRRLGDTHRVDADVAHRSSQYILPENVVIHVRLARMLDRVFSSTMYNAYVPKEFETFTVRNEEHGQKITALIFRSGRTVLTGTRDPVWTYLGAHRVRLELAANGKDTTLEELVLDNMVYNIKIPVKHGIDLGEMFASNRETSLYLPTRFPGLQFLHERYGVKLRFFDTGYLVIMGARNARRVVGIILAAIKMVAEFPDDNLPDPHERFEYRKRNKIRACSRAAYGASSAMTTSTSASNAPPCK